MGEEDESEIILKLLLWRLHMSRFVRNYGCRCFTFLMFQRAICCKRQDMIGHIEF